MGADFGFGCGRKDRFRKLLGHFEPLGELNAADTARGLVVLPAAADDVAAGNALNQNRGEALDNHGAARDLVDFVGRNNRCGINAR